MMFKEFEKHHGMKTFIPIYGNKLTKKEQLGAPGSLLFLTEKRDGKIKAIKCDDRINQCKTIKKEDEASPTVTLN